MQHEYVAGQQCQQIGRGDHLGNHVAGQAIMQDPAAALVRHLGFGAPLKWGSHAAQELKKTEARRDELLKLRADAVHQANRQLEALFAACEDPVEAILSKASEVRHILQPFDDGVFRG